MNCEEQINNDCRENEHRSEADVIEYLSLCLDEGWSPTKCPKGCRVEPDGICPEGYESLAITYGLI